MFSSFELKNKQAAWDNPAQFLQHQLSSSELQFSLVSIQVTASHSIYCCSICHCDIHMP